MKSFHLPLRAIRKDLNLSQEAVAAALHIQTTTYSKIERGMIQLTLPRLYELSRIFHLSVEEILSYGKRKDRPDSKHHNITYVPVHAQAGFLDNYADQSGEQAFTTFSIPSFTEKNLYMISVEGDSMYPTITPGAFIIIKATDKNLIRWGEPHVVVTTEGRVIKRILQSRDKACISLYSDNSLYERYDVPKKQVLSLWLIVGKVTRSFAPQMFLQEKENTR